jgi:uncharacterized membrane protein
MTAMRPPFAEESTMNHLRLIGLVTAALGGLFLGCGGSDEPGLPAVDCSKVTVQKFSELTIWPICINCHASSKMGTARMLAPANVNFDTHAAAMAQATRAAIRVNNGTMPPPGGTTAPSADQKAALINWAVCGAPN